MATIHGTEATATELTSLALTGYGHFTSMHVEDGSVRGFDLHLERLVRDANSVFGADLDRDTLVADTRAVISGSTGSYTLRVTVFDPAINLGNIGTVAAHPVPLIASRPGPAGRLSPVHVKTIAFQRDAPGVKHIGLFGSLHQRVAAKKAGFDDVLFTDPITTNLSECNTWNIGFVTTDKSVVWPDAPVLPGVTMALLQDNGGHVLQSIPVDQIG